MFCRAYSATPKKSLFKLLLDKNFPKEILELAYDLEMEKESLLHKVEKLESLSKITKELYLRGYQGTDKINELYITFSCRTMGKRKGYCS